MARSRNRDLKCSFCGRTQDEVDHLLAGPSGLYICNYCVQDAYQAILDDDLGQGELDGGAATAPFEQQKLPTPAELVAYLDQYVIGQDYAKKSCRWPSTTTTNGFVAKVKAARSRSKKATFC